MNCLFRGLYVIEKCSVTLFGMRNSVEVSPFATARQRPVKASSSESDAADVTEAPMRRRSRESRGRGRTATETETHSRSFEQDGLRVTQQLKRTHRRRNFDGRTSPQLPVPTNPADIRRSLDASSTGNASVASHKSAASLRTSEEEMRNTVAVRSATHLSLAQLQANEFGGFRSQAAQEVMRAPRTSREGARRRRSHDIEMGPRSSAGLTSSDDEPVPSTRQPSVNITINQGNTGSGGLDQPRRGPQEALGRADRDDRDPPTLRGVFWGLGPQLDVESLTYRATVGCLQALQYIVLGGGGIVLTGTVIHTIVKTEGTSSGAVAPAPAPF